jgi:hypothetical protein
VTTRRRKQAGPATRQPAATPFTFELSEEDRRELRERDFEGYEYPDGSLPGLPRDRPGYVVVIDQLRGQWPDQPRSLNEILESLAARTRDPEPDLEAEP